jgi:transposase
VISPEIEANILRLHHAEGWPPGTIAHQLEIHPDVVLRVIEQAQKPKPGLTRPSLVDPYMPFILETLKKYPKLKASRLYSMVKERGYTGGPSHFRNLIARYRPSQPPEAYLRLKTLIGEQAQVDWAHFGKVTIGKALRPLMAFVMVLSFSRAIFLRFFLSQSLANFLRGHEAAFNAFSGIPRVILYDNPKVVVLERFGDAIRFNPELLKFSGHCRFEPRPVAVARANEKDFVSSCTSVINRP